MKGESLQLYHTTFVSRMLQHFQRGGGTKQIILNSHALSEIGSRQAGFGVQYFWIHVKDQGALLA